MYVLPLAPPATDESRFAALAAPLVAPVNMNRLALDDADDDAFEVLGLAPGLALPVGLLPDCSTDCRQPVTVTFLRCWMVFDDAPLDCASTPTRNANVIAAAVIQMARFFTGVSFARGALRRRCKPYA
jgi:hypothetical protein